MRAKKDEETIGLFESRILRCIFGAIQYKRRKNAREDITLKYINYIMNSCNTVGRAYDTNDE